MQRKGDCGRAVRYHHTVPLPSVNFAFHGRKTCRDWPGPKAFRFPDLRIPPKRNPERGSLKTRFHKSLVEAVLLHEKPLGPGKEFSTVSGMSYDFANLQLFILLSSLLSDQWRSGVLRDHHSVVRVVMVAPRSMLASLELSTSETASVSKDTQFVLNSSWDSDISTLWYTRINRNSIHFSGAILIAILPLYLSGRKGTNNRHPMNCAGKAFTVSTLSALLHSTHLSNQQWLCDKQSVVLQSEWELRKLAFNSFRFRITKSSYVPSYCAPTIGLFCISWHIDMQRLARKVGRVKHWKLRAVQILQNKRKESGRLLRKFLMVHWLKHRPMKCAVCTHRA